MSATFRPFDTLLVANRGEIAIRVARSARAEGLGVVMVFTEADAGALHLGAGDRAVRVPDYLDGAALVQAALRAGAEAVHPGYGFLAENADFAQSVLDAGLVWVGPPPEAIRAMGSKTGSRRLMSDHGVPVVPGYDGEDDSDATLLARAEDVGFPLMVKASAGGGGKGMAVVRERAGLLDAIAGARRLAGSAFGDSRLLLERYLPRARHVEVQVLADAHGHTVHLFERECSVQRRHQKVIEEAPSPALSSGQRAALCADGVKAARAAGYVGAGTVEFMLDEHGKHHFLEMNTRIQVEHPVTEAVTGVDLVAWQLRVAAGESLDALETPRIDGWAIEARIYAEDPDDGYLPQTGTLLAWHEPAGVRVDSGVTEGSEVGIHYDPMLAKVVAHGRDREQARRRLVRALEDLVVAGLRCNAEHLLRVLRHPVFAAGALHTGFLDEHAATLGPAPELPRRALVAVVAHDWLARRDRAVLPQVGGWRNNRWRPSEVTLRWRGAEHALRYLPSGDGLELDGVPLRVLSTHPLRLEHDGVVFAAVVVPDGDRRWVHVDGGSVVVDVVPDFALPGAQDDEGGCTAPMPGKVAAILVEAGQAVQAGQALVIIEAMKMEQTLTAPLPGTVQAIRVAVGDQVDAGQVLVELSD